MNALSVAGVACRRPWRSRLVVALTALVAAGACAGLLTTAPATAGTYTTYQCSLPNGQAIAAPDVIPSYAQPWSYYSTGCSGGLPNMGVSFEPNATHGPGMGAQLVFSAPANTTITSLTANRTMAVGYGSAYRTPVAAITTNQGTIDVCAAPYGCTSRGSGAGNQIANLIGAGGLNAQWVSFNVSCGGGMECGPENPKANVTVYHAAFGLDDNSDPATGAVNGPLVAPGVKNGTLAASYQASDQGGGVYRTVIKIDGNAAAADVIDANGGRCADAVPGGNPYEFTRAVPCKLSASATPTLNTASIVDGNHSLSLEVEDAAGNRTVAFAPTTYTFDNQPPAGGSVTVSGAPRAGQTLTLAAAGFNGQNPTTTYQWLRCDPTGNACQAISGATNTSYTLDQGDVAKTIRARVTAADQGGNTTVESQPTAQVQPFPPPDSGAVTIDGEPRVAQLLTSAVTGFAGQTEAVYQWQRCDTASTGCVNLPGADKPTYKLVPGDVNKYVRVVVTASNAGGSRSATSNAMGKVLREQDPGSGTKPTTPAPGATNGSGSGAGTPNGVGATREAIIKIERAQSRRSVKYGRTINIIGRLVTPSGKGIEGAAVDILERVKLRGEAPKRVAVVRTDKRGFFRYVTSPGPSRAFDASYRAFIPGATSSETAVTYDAQQRVELTVAAAVKLTVTPRSVRNGQALTFRGQLRGGPIPKPGRTILIQAQAKRGRKGQWVTFLNVRTTNKGTFRGTYRLTQTRRATGYRFRAVSPIGTDYPYGAGASKTAKVRVRK